MLLSGICMTFGNADVIMTGTGFVYVVFRDTVKSKKLMMEE